MRVGIAQIWNRGYVRESPLCFFDKDIEGTLISYGDFDMTNYSRNNLCNVIWTFAGLYALELVLLEILGTQDDLETSSDHSVLVASAECVKTSEVDAMFENEIEVNLD